MLRAALLLAGISCLAAASQTAAHDYPSRPIRIVVPFTPGTGMDIIARSVGPVLSDHLGQAVVIDNRPGASGNLGAGLVARSAADGHTLMVSGNPLIVSAHLYRNVPFRPLADFAPVSLAAWGTLMLVAGPSTRMATVADLLSQAKAAPGRITYASPGIGTPHHLSMELLRERTGTQFLHVPYKGSAGAVTEVLSGQVGVMFIPIHIGLPFVKSGKLKALAVGSAARHPAAPDLPTLQETGVKGADVGMWYGFLAPRGTPAAVVGKLSGELRGILAQPEVKTGFSAQGMEPAPSTPAEFGALMRREDALWAGIIRRNRIRAD